MSSPMDTTPKEVMSPADCGKVVNNNVDKTDENVNSVSEVECVDNGEQPEQSDVECFRFEAFLEIKEEETPSRLPSASMPGSSNSSPNSLAVCAQDKNCFKLRRSRRRRVCVVIRQADGPRPLRVHKCFGLLLAAGRNVRHSDMHLLDMKKWGRGDDNTSYEIEALWDPNLPNFVHLNTETHRDTRMYFTVAADMVLFGIHEPVRFSLECKARVFHQHERFWYTTRKPMVEQYYLHIRKVTSTPVVPSISQSQSTSELSDASPSSQPDASTPQSSNSNQNQVSQSGSQLTPATARVWECPRAPATFHPYEVARFESETERQVRLQRGINGTQQGTSATQLVLPAESDESDSEEPLLSGSGAPMAQATAEVMAEWRAALHAWKVLVNRRHFHIQGQISTNTPDCWRRPSSLDILLRSAEVPDALRAELWPLLAESYARVQGQAGGVLGNGGSAVASVIERVDDESENQANKLQQKPSASSEDFDSCDSTDEQVFPSVVTDPSLVDSGQNCDVIASEVAEKPENGGLSNSETVENDAKSESQLTDETRETEALSVPMLHDDLADTYRLLVGKECSSEQVILRDIHRTFPAHDYFRSPGSSGQDALFRLSKAYALYDEEVGYCQGLSFLGAALLLHLPEAAAFGVLVRIMFDYGLRDLFKHGFDALHLRFYQLQRLMDHYARDLASHLLEQRVETHMFASQWFLTLFTAKFPLGMVYNIIDLFLSEGMNTIFHISLALLNASKSDLKQLDFEGILKYFRVTLPRKYRSESAAKDLILQAIKLTMSHKRLTKYENEYVAMRQKAAENEDPRELLERERQTRMRLERENDDLAHELVTSKVELRVLLDAAEDNVESLQAQVERATRRCADLLEENKRLVDENEQVKELCRREMQQAAELHAKHEGIISNYKQICSDYGRRLEDEQTGRAADRRATKRRVADCGRCQVLFDSEGGPAPLTNDMAQGAGAPALSPMSCEQIMMQSVTELHLASSAALDADLSASELRSQCAARDDVIRKLELELAETKLALVEAQCKNQDLSHQLSAVDTATSPSGDAKLAMPTNTWLKKTFSSIKDNAHRAATSLNKQQMQSVFVTQNSSQTVQTILRHAMTKASAPPALARAPIKGVMLDVTGVLYDSGEGDGKAIAKSVDAVKRLQDSGLKVRFVSNECTNTQADFLSRLHRLGFSIEPDQLFTPVPAAKAYLKEHKLRPHLLVHPAIESDFSEVDRSSPNCVLLGDAGESFSWKNMNAAFQALAKMELPKLITMGYGKYYKETDGLKLDVGAYSKILEFACDLHPIIVGKPSPLFFATAIESMGINKKNVIMIGDDIVGDVGGAHAAAFRGALVRTGKFRLVGGRSFMINVPSGA